ncbi:MAG: ribonuclease III family protein [Miltoncostaeaceae bacterium]
MDPVQRREALTHTTWAGPASPSFERLEFLGDAVLGVIVTTELFVRHPDASEGDLTFMRQRVVSREACAQVASACGLPDRMVNEAPRRHAGEARGMAGSRNVRAALAESVIGAGWLGAGPDATAHAVLSSFSAALDAAPDGAADPKSALQEALQAAGGVTARYEITGQDGPPHARTFHARVLQGDRELAHGSGGSKQAAERSAAARALDVIARDG